MNAYDPTDSVTRPKDSYHPNLNYFNVGIGELDGKKDFGNETHSNALDIKKLTTLINENGDRHKSITYLKMDVEADELRCYNQWLKSGIFKDVEQLGIEMHLGNHSIKKNEIKRVYKDLIKFVQTLDKDYGLRLVGYNPNLCIGSDMDWQRIHQSFHDLLFVRPLKLF